MESGVYYSCEGKLESNSFVSCGSKMEYMKCKSSKICTSTALDGDEKMDIIGFEFGGI